MRRILAGGEAGGHQSSMRPLRIVGVTVEYPHIRLEFAPDTAGYHQPTMGHSGDDQFTGPQPSEPQPHTTRAGTRRAVAVMAGLWVSGAAAWQPHRAKRNSAAGGPGTSSHEQQTAESGSTEESGRTRLDGTHQLHPTTPQGESNSPGDVVTWSPGEHSWEEFLTEVSMRLTNCSHATEAIPGELLRRIAARAGSGLHGLYWVTEDQAVARQEADAQSAQIQTVSDSKNLTVAEYPAPGRSHTSRWLPRVELSTTEQIAVMLRKEMTHSGHRPGDRLHPHVFAQRLRLPVSTVRTAMRQLADDGLLAHAGSEFRIPSVTGTDVVDLYAARLHVGTVLLRAAAHQPRHELLPARLTLGTLRAAAAQGSRSDVGEADLRFQQEIAEASGLTQSARSFHALTLRLRMFISVLQLDYSPAVERIAGDGRRLLSAVLEGRADDAVRIWRSKLDDAVRHMSALSPDTFDAQLWFRLTR